MNKLQALAVAQQVFGPSAIVADVIGACSVGYRESDGRIKIVNTDINWQLAAARLTDPSKCKVGDIVRFVYNGKHRTGIVEQSMLECKNGSTIIKVHCDGDDFPKSFKLEGIENYTGFGQ